MDNSFIFVQFKIIGFIIPFFVEKNLQVLTAKQNDEALIDFT